MRTLVSFAAVFALVATACAVDGRPQASPAGCVAQADPSSGGAGDLLLAVTGAPKRAVAVGVHYVGGDGRALVMRRAGGAWSVVHVPIDGNKAVVQLQDAATAGSTTWSVGAYRNDAPVAGTLSGRHWRWTSPVDPGALEDEFLGVATAPGGAVWAVGKHQVRDRDYQPLIERYDGRSWTVVPSPPIGGSAVLKDVAFGSDGAGWAVGWAVGEGGVATPVIERWDGSRWSLERAAGGGVLTGVAMAPDGAPVAVGWREADDGDRIVSLRLVRGAWAPIAGDGDPGRLTAIASGTAVVASGLRDGADGLPVPVAFVYRHGWQPIDLGVVPAAPGGGQLLGVTADGADVAAVGLQAAESGFASLLVTGTCAG
jgi:hypothetical protein